MTEGEGSSSLIELGIWDTELLDAICGLTGEGLVYLEAIDVFDFETALLEDSWDGDGWSDTHVVDWDTNGFEPEDSSLDWETKFLGVGSSGQKRDSSSISDLTGVTSSGGSTLLESWLQFSKSFHRGLWTNSAISINHNGLLVSFLIFKNSLVWSNFFFGTIPSFVRGQLFCEIQQPWHPFEFL